MGFEYKATTETGDPVLLKFKPYGDAPGRISRHNIGHMEAQVWAYLEWGLEEPEHWPPESTILSGANVFDVIPQRDITKMYSEWQRTDDDEPPKKRPVKAVAKSEQDD